MLSTDFYNDSNQFNSYKKLTLKVVEHLGAAVDLNKNFTDETERMLNLEREISKLQLDENSRHNSTYKNMTIAELQQKLPKVINNLPCFYIKLTILFSLTGKNTFETCSWEQTTRI